MISIDFTPPLPPGERPIETDLTCHKCKYNLRGLTPNSNCPECGTPVAFSTRGDLLRYSDPAWVADLPSGIWCILWGVLMTVASSIIAVFLKIRYRDVDLSIATALVSTGASILHVYGAWILTAPDPSGLGEDRYGMSRKLIRVTLLIGVLQHVFGLLTLKMNLPPDLYWAAIALGLASALASVVGVFAMLNYLGKLARRIPDELLADRAGRLMWEFGIPLAVFAFFGLIAFASDGQSAAIMLLFSCVVILGLMALLVVFMRYFAFLGSLAGEFQQQAEIAAVVWAKPRANL